MNHVETGPTRDHTSYIGGSDIAALAGAHPYKTPLDVWAEKLGKSTFEGNDRTELGDHFERPAIELYRRRVGAESIEYPGTLVHPQDPFLGATPDAIRDGNRDVQCKIVGLNQAHRWGEPEDGPDGVPPEVFLQVHWESWAIKAALDIRGEVADVPAVIGTDLRTFEVPIDWDIVEGLEVLARSFWLKHVKTGLVPEPTGDESLDTLRALFPKPMREKLERPTEDVVELVRAYDIARSEEGEAKARKMAAGGRLCLLIGDGLGFEGDGVRVKWPLRPGKVAWKEAAQGYRMLALKFGHTREELDKIEKSHTGAPARNIDVRIGEKYE